MNSKILTEAFWIVICFLGIGGFIDFMIGKGAQKKLRDWMEINWYKYADVRWLNFGQSEAAAFLRITNKLFGENFFSRQRLIATFITAIVGAILPLTSYLFPSDNFETSISQNNDWWTSILFGFTYAIVFALSISFSQTIGKIIIKLYGRNQYVNFLLTILTLIVSYVFLVAWSPSYNYFATRITIIVSELAAGEKLAQETIYWFSNFPLDTWINILFWLTPSEYWWPSNVFFKNMDIYLECMLVDHCGWRAMAIDNSIANFLLIAGPIYRLIILSAFVASNALEWLIRKPASIIWARIIESDKPIFSLVFGGLAVFLKAIQEIIKHYS